jgi:hypothetical protein
MRKYLVALLALLTSLGVPAGAADLPTHKTINREIARNGIWGAIAYSIGDRKHGFFWGADKPEEANGAAVKYCQDAGGEACRVVTLFRNHRHWDDDDRSGFPYFQCAALASDAATRAWAAAAAETHALAEENALRSCRKGGGGCETVEWVCT